MNRIIFYTLTTLLMLITLTACGVLQHETKPLTKGEDVQTSIESSKREKQRQNEKRALKQARQLLSEKDYSGTLIFIQEEIAKGIDQQVLSKEYLQAVNGSLIQADTFMEQGQYAKAALLYKGIQESLPQSHDLQEQRATLPALLREKIGVCTEKLMEEGLLAYRSGEFTTAINIWEKVIEFNPQHQAAQDSINTTKRQLSNLESIDSKN